ELFGEEDRHERLANVAVSLTKSFRNAIDECRRWIVSHKVAHQFGSDKFRGRRMMREYVEHHQSVFHTTTGRNLVPENSLLAVVMRAHVEEERSSSPAHRIAHSCIALTVARHGRIQSGSAATRLEDSPTGKTTRHFLHVFLRVTTIDSERVQFHQLARVVFVDTASLLLRSKTTSICIRTDALKVVEVKQHRRTLRCRFE